MFKKIIFSIVAVITFLFSSSQSRSISPDISQQFCPGSNITFTVTLPLIKSGTIPTIASWLNGAQVVSGATNITHGTNQTTFTFVGKFNDINQTQEYRVSWEYPNSTTDFHIFTFKYIKSLWAYTSCSNINPNSYTITSPACQVNTHQIFFNNVQWGNSSESQPFCFGSITEYEYLLPSGWSMNSTTSNGSDWISGDNNETVTSDASTGGVIKVRPKTCATGLQNNVFTTIQISRPGPTLNIPETTTEICTSRNFTVSGVPSGATVTWSLSNNNVVGSLSNQSNSGVTVTKTGSGTGSETLTASVTLCGVTYTTPGKVLWFGKPTAYFDIIPYLPYYPDCYEVDAFYVFRATESWYGEGYTSYEWGHREKGTTQWTINNSNSSDAAFIFSTPGTYEIMVKPVNDCGVSTVSESMIEIDVVFLCNNLMMSVSPNPASTEMNVTLDETEASKEKNKDVASVQFNLIDVYTNQVIKQWKLAGNQKQYKLNVAGVKKGQYVLQVIKGSYKTTKQVIIK